MGVARLNAHGQLDTSFGNGSGFVLSDVAGGYDAAMAVLVQADGKIVVAGSADVAGASRFAVGRYQSNGMFDASFSGGMTTLAFAGDSFGNAIAIDGAGKLVVAGNVMIGQNFDFGVARLQNTVDQPVPPPPPPPPPLPASGTAVLTADPANPGKQMLVVQGTSRADTIRFMAAKKGAIEVRLNGQKLGTFSGMSRIVATGGAGNDAIDASGSSVPVVLFGGDGNDRMVGSRFGDILVGGAGNDDLYGNFGDDLIVGGAGKDDLHSVLGNDLLIGGSLSFENDLASVTAVHGEWERTDLTLAQRIAHLQSGGGKNGAILLNSASIVDDAARDTMHGTANADWLIGGAGDKIDQLKAIKPKGKK